MLQPFNRSNQPTVPPLMQSYIHNRVARRAALISVEANWQLELGKSRQLVGIEERYRSDVIKRAARGRP